MYTGVQYNSSKKGNSTCSLWQRKEENAAINWQGRSFWLAVSFKPSSSIRMYVRTYVHSVRIKDAWRLRNTTLHSCVAHHQFLFATLHRGTLSCQFVPGAVGWKHGGPRRGWSGGGGKKKRRYAWYDTAGGEQSRGGGVHLPLCFTFYCLPWIRPICIKRRTPPLSLGYSLAARKIARSDTHTHTHTNTQQTQSGEEARDAFQQRAICPIVSSVVLSSSSSGFARNFRQSGGERSWEREPGASLSLVSWTKLGESLRHADYAKLERDVTADREKGRGAWMGGVLKTGIEFMTKGNFVSGVVRRLKFN